MTKEQFIEEAAKYVKEFAPKYNICVYSAPIAQFILESAAGTSELAVNAHNYAGLKYREGRCPTACGVYYKVGSEQDPITGEYTSSAMQWFKFPDFRSFVQGYFDFTNISNYKSLKGVTDPETYLRNIKNSGFATSIKYVENCLNVIKQYDLTRFDPVVESAPTVNSKNSPLVTYTNISPNKTFPRNHKIDTITIHCIVGQWTAKQGCDYFAKSTAKASANYVVGKDGSIGLSVEESDRSWCSSNATNDHRAITIEVASDTSHPYAVTDKALAALIELCADICRRNGIKKLVWSTDKNERVNHLNGCNMTVHRDFKNKACPGEYLYERHGYIADEVNKRLGVASSTPTTSTPSVTPKSLYRVRKTWADAASQKGAYSSLDNAKKNCPSGYSVFDESGNVVYSNAPVEDGKKYYRVQTGAYAMQKNAVALQEKLQKIGFSAIVKKVGLLYKVQVGAYSQKANADAMLAQLKAKGFNGFITYN